MPVTSAVPMISPSKAPMILVSLKMVKIFSDASNLRAKRPQFFFLVSFETITTLFSFLVVLASTVSTVFAEEALSLPFLASDFLATLAFAVAMENNLLIRKFIP